MDNGWERSVPFYTMDLNTVSALFRQFDPNLRIASFTPLSEGKRTTNYRVDTSADHSFILRIFPAGDSSWLKEAGLRALVSDRVPMQRLHHLEQHSNLLDGRTFAIYDFAEGATLLELWRKGFVPEPSLMGEIGSALGQIHRHRYDRIGFLNERLEIAEELAPADTWYDLFLNRHARKRLGGDVAEQIERVVQDNKAELHEMDRAAALTHGDFRPTNLIIQQGRVSSIIDWEFAMAGHPIADIAQFFRYENQFSPRLKEAFIDAYQDISGNKLPEQWEQIGGLRDMVNLLQMIGTEDEQPVKHEDVKRLILRQLHQYRRGPKTRQS